MALERITIALIGDDAARAAAKRTLADFVAHKMSQNVPGIETAPVNPEKISDDVVRNFRFKDCDVEIIEVTEFNENLPKFDGAIWAELKEKPPISLKQLVQKNKDIELTVTDEGEDPYFRLAEQIDCAPYAYQRLYFYPKTKELSEVQQATAIDQKQTSNTQSQNHETTQAKNSAAGRTFATIDNTLNAFIRLKKMSKAERKSDGKTTASENIIPLEVTVEASSLSQKPSRKKLWLLLFPAISLLASIAISVMMGLKLLTLPIPFIALPIALFVLTFILVGIIYTAMKKDQSSMTIGSMTPDSNQPVIKASNNTLQGPPTPVTYSSPIQNQTKVIDAPSLAIKKQHCKIRKKGGGKGDATFIAFVNDKKYFLRNNEVNNFQKEINIISVLASKLARAISKQHFASEHLLSDGKVASRALPDIAILHPHVLAHEYYERAMSNRPTAQ